MYAHAGLGDGMWLGKKFVKFVKFVDLKNLRDLWHLFEIIHIFAAKFGL